MKVVYGFAGALAAAAIAACGQTPASQLNHFQYTGRIECARAYPSAEARRAAQRAAGDELFRRYARVFIAGEADDRTFRFVIHTKDATDDITAVLERERRIREDVQRLVCPDAYRI